MVDVIVKSDMLGKKTQVTKLYDGNQTVGDVLDDNPDIFRFQDCKFGHHLCTAAGVATNNEKGKLDTIRNLPVKDCGGIVCLLSRPEPY